jgi:hypothetical protein
MGDLSDGVGVLQIVAGAVGIMLASLFWCSVLNVGTCVAGTLRFHGDECGIPLVFVSMRVPESVRAVVRARRVGWRLRLAPGGLVPCSRRWLACSRWRLR